VQHAAVAALPAKQQQQQQQRSALVVSAADARLAYGGGQSRAPAYSFIHFIH